MNLLDLQTVYVIAGMLYVLMPVVVWLALRAQSNRVVVLWCAGGELFGLSLLLIALRNQLPEPLTYELANLLMVGGNIVRLHALASELKRPLPRILLITSPVAFIAAYTTIRWLYPHSVYYFVWTMLVMIFLVLSVASLAGEIADQQKSASARVLAGTYWILAVVLGFRILEVVTGWSETGPFSQSAITTALGITGIITAVLGNTSFLGIFVERSVHERLVAAQERARREENDRLGRQIAHLDRQRAMGMLFTSLNHELSQPLTNMQLLTDRAEIAAKRGERADPAQLSFIEGLQRNLRYALDIVARVRGFVKAEGADFQVTSLQEINGNVMALLADWLRYESVQVRIRQPQLPVLIRGDTVQLAQTLVNLYRNAVQASAGQAERIVDVTIEQNGGQGSIKINDNGPGFSEEALLQVGTPFYTTKGQGLGIGLSIVHNIIEKHQGKLKLSNGANGGAVAKITLPLAQPAAA